MADIVLDPRTDIEKIEILGGYVLILPHEENKSKLLVAPDRWKHESFRGTIIKLADGVPDLRLGMDVLFSPYSHRSVDINGQLLFLVHSSDVSAVLKAGVSNARPHSKR